MKENIYKSAREVSIETNRLFLRVFKEEDVTEDYVKALNDPSILKYTEARYRTTPFTLTAALEYIKQANQEGSVLIGIFLKSGQHMGNIRLHSISEHNRRVELGIMLWNKSLWRMGFGTEALEAVTLYVFRDLGLHKVEAEYYSTNIASAKIFAKAGYQVEGIIRDHFIVDDKYVDAIRIAKINPNK